MPVEHRLEAAQLQSDVELIGKLEVIARVGDEDLELQRAGRFCREGG